MDKLQAWSRRFRFLFQILLVLTPIAVVAFWIAPEAVGRVPFLGPDFSINFLPLSWFPDHFQNWSGSLRFLAMLITFIPVGFNMLILLWLVRLFKLYEQGVIFTSRNVSLVRGIGVLMLMKAVVNPIYQVLISLTLSWDYSVQGHRVIAFDISRAQIESVLMALLIILVSWIMLEGSKLQDEQMHTV